MKLEEKLFKGSCSGGLLINLFKVILEPQEIERMATSDT